MKKLDEILKNERIWGHEIMFPFHSAWVKLPECGKCSVIWSDCEDGMEHVSVSPKKQFRMPSWDDMCVLKDIFFEDEEEAYQIHPKKSQYVNAVENCLHLWKPKGHEIDELTKLEKQSQWIPVSERLPEESLNSVIGWDAYRERCCFVQQLNGRFVLGNGEDIVDIVAWMPLPEPWKGE